MNGILAFELGMIRDRRYHSDDVIRQVYRNNGAYFVFRITIPLTIRGGFLDTSTIKIDERGMFERGMFHDRCYQTQ